jgi:hypothetical protein
MPPLTPTWPRRLAKTQETIEADGKAQGIKARRENPPIPPCPKCRRVTETEMGYGLAGGGIGPYMFCTVCYTVLYKWEDADN